MSNLPPPPIFGLSQAASLDHAGLSRNGSKNALRLDNLFDEFGDRRHSKGNRRDFEDDLEFDDDEEDFSGDELDADGQKKRKFDMTEEQKIERR